MREVLKESKCFDSFSKGRPNRRHHDHGGVLDTIEMMTYSKGTRWKMCVGAQAGAHMRNGRGACAQIERASRLAARVGAQAGRKHRRAWRCRVGRSSGRVGRACGRVGRKHDCAGRARDCARRSRSCASRARGCVSTARGCTSRACNHAGKERMTRWGMAASVQGRHARRATKAVTRA